MFNLFVDEITLALFNQLYAPIIIIALLIIIAFKKYGIIFVLTVILMESCREFLDFDSLFDPLILVIGLIGFLVLYALSTLLTSRKQNQSQ